jgi:hypothetical protein
MNAYQQRIITALQEAGVLERGLTERNYTGDSACYLNRPGEDDDEFAVAVNTREYEDRDVTFIHIRKPKPPISPTAKALKELQA